MAENREELLDYYRASRADFLTAIEGLSDVRLTEESLDGWSVKHHLLHIAAWDEIRAAEVVRISAGFESAWRMTSEQDDAFNEMTYQIRKGLSLAQARWEFATSRQALLDAITAAPERALDASLYGNAGLKTGHETEHTDWIKRWRREKRF